MSCLCVCVSVHNIKMPQAAVGCSKIVVYSKLTQNCKAHFRSLSILPFESSVYLISFVCMCVCA